jgi:Flp pilus assembly protein protease CpaA
MQEHYFLFILAFVFTTAAVVQDLKRREVANWINFSFIASALAYRAFYASINKSLNFLILGFAGLVVFFILAHILYYSRAFAGGDAKLLMGYGIILPYQNYQSLLILSIVFIFLLFAVGAVYSLTYSIAIAIKNKTKFKKEISLLAKKHKSLALTLVVLTILSIVVYQMFSLILFLLLLTLLTYIYTKSIDTCMIVLTPPTKLTEGDWILDDIKISKNKTVKKTVHGLSSNDIKLLKKHKKKILVKTGIPFTPAFLISLIVMVFFFLILQSSVEQVFSFLSSQFFSLP